MNMNVGIIDQQVRGLAQRLRSELADVLDRPNLDDTAARSVAFLVLLTLGAFAAGKDFPAVSF